MPAELKTGKVLIQTYNPEHYAIKLAQTQDYERFYGYEMRVRHAGNYPPYFYTVLISVASKKNRTRRVRLLRLKDAYNRICMQVRLFLVPHQVQLHV